MNERKKIIIPALEPEVKDKFGIINEMMVSQKEKDAITQQWSVVYYTILLSANRLMGVFCSDRKNDGGYCLHVIYKDYDYNIKLAHIYLHESGKVEPLMTTDITCLEDLVAAGGDGYEIWFISEKEAFTKDTLDIAGMIAA